MSLLAFGALLVPSRGVAVVAVPVVAPTGVSCIRLARRVAAGLVALLGGVLGAGVALTALVFAVVLVAFTGAPRLLAPAPVVAALAVVVLALTAPLGAALLVALALLAA